MKAAATPRRWPRRRLDAGLERAAAAAALASGVRCATDVTGFGLIGHLAEMTAASGVGGGGDRRRGAAAARRPRAGGGRGHDRGAARNRAFAEGLAVDPGGRPAPEVAELLFDPQTSGGLLLAVAPAAADALDGGLDDRGVTAAVGRLDRRAGRDDRVVA